ncbi:MAG: Fic family protein [Gammaproteobacteria bacterium]|nr:Fic family protein [Gammaproteobacteria bacterium]
MTDRTRYTIEGLAEGEQEPGAIEPILRNRLGLRSQAALDQAERLSLEMTQTRLLELYTRNHRFTAADLCKVHALWLGDIYTWAGHYRQVNLSKDGFLFAAAHQVPHLMQQYEVRFLKRYTPCCFKNLDEVASAIAITHAELILIHPFREGNGRLARLFANLMALQAGLPFLDFKTFVEERPFYIAGIQESLEVQYERLTALFKTVIQKTLAQYRP